MRRVEEGGNIVGAVSVGGERVRRPGEVEPAFTIELPVRELTSAEAIGCGFQTAWGSVDVDGDELELFGGAGLGSGWATVSFRGKTYGLAAHELVEAVLAAVAPEALKEAS